MTKRLLMGVLVAVLFVAATAGPAAAADGGIKHINFPKHDCSGAVPTHVDLYVTGDAFQERGRISYYSGTCAKAARLVHIYTIILWEYYGGTWHNVSWSGIYDLDVTSGRGTWQTPYGACNGNKAHVEVQYRIYWKDGTSTNTRDDNSYDWNPSCTT
jgi:hypothetical protein